MIVLPVVLLQVLLKMFFPSFQLIHQLNLPQKGSPLKTFLISLLITKFVASNVHLPKAFSIETHHLLFLPLAVFPELEILSTLDSWPIPLLFLRFHLRHRHTIIRRVTFMLTTRFLTTIVRIPTCLDRIFTQMHLVSITFSRVWQFFILRFYIPVNP